MLNVAHPPVRSTILVGLPSTSGSFAGNTVAAGLRTDAGSRMTLDLRRNWWNDPSGPGGEGPGSGDPVFNVGNPRSTLLLGNHLQKAKHCWK